MSLSCCWRGPLVASRVRRRRPHAADCAKDEASRRRRGRRHPHLLRRRRWHVDVVVASVGVCLLGWLGSADTPFPFLPLTFLCRRFWPIDLILAHALVPRLLLSSSPPLHVRRPSSALASFLSYGEGRLGERAAGSSGLHTVSLASPLSQSRFRHTGIDRPHVPQ